MNHAPTIPLQKPQPDHRKTTRRPANAKPARHAGVESGMASRRSGAPWCTTSTDDHADAHKGTPQPYHYTTDQPTTTNYFESSAPRESGSSTESGGASTGHGMQVP